MTDRADNEIDALLRQWELERTAEKEQRMTNDSQREALVSTGEHAHAVARLRKPSYSAEEYLQAVDAARDAGLGEQYADDVLGVDVDSVLAQDDGDELLEAARSRLQRRGIDPDSCSYEQLRDALIRSAG